MKIDAIQPEVLEEWPRGGATRFREVVRALKEGGRGALPRVEGVEFRPLVRWFYRVWMTSLRGKKEGAAGPLMMVDPVHLEGADEGEAEGVNWWGAARGGMLAVEGRLEALPAGLKAALLARELVMIEAGEEALRVDEGFRQALLGFDGCHGTAVDESLKYVRRSLLANCRSASPVHLKGEASTGKRGLARWAHGMLDEEPMAEVRGETGLPSPGRWTFFDEVGGLGREQRQALKRLLERYEMPPGVRVEGREGRRPGHRAFRSILGKSQALTDVLVTVEGLSKSALTMLLLGEPGVGKESLARAIHEISGRSGPFVAIDMGAIAENLAESELFGHVKGAFTGAERERKGAFRSAEGGTLFLDEIGNLTPTLQMRLLRVLQERQVMPVGADRPVDVDVRVVAATNADLRLMVMQGTFRQDLLSRLSAATVKVPPLRERIGDIEELARSFLGAARVEAGPDDALWTGEVDEILRGYGWPGNIRELANVMGYAAALSGGRLPIEAEHLGPLSPKKMRATPLITTFSGEEALPVEGMPMGLHRLMTLTTLTVPPFRERSRRSRRQRILEELKGRPMTERALEVLESAPWYGNGMEIHHRLRPLLMAGEGVLDLEAVRGYLPDLFSTLSQAPIQILLSPVRQPDGRVGGLRFDHDRGALLVGRVRHVDELRRQGDDPKVAQWLKVIDEVCEGAEPGCLDVSLLGRLSRAHLLFHRDADGLAVTLMPGTHLVARAAALTDELEELRAGQSFSLGAAGEVELRSGRGTLYLHLFAFSGAVAFEQYAEAALRRAEAHRGQAGKTLATQAEVRSIGGGAVTTPSRGLSRGLRVWELSEVEVEALIDVVASYRGGQFNRHVLSSLSMLEGRPSCEHLVEYLRDAPRKAQYVVRLFEKEENEALREGLMARFAGLEDRAVRVGALPAGLQRVVEG